MSEKCKTCGSWLYEPSEVERIKARCIDREWELQQDVHALLKAATNAIPRGDKQDADYMEELIAVVARLSPKYPRSHEEL